MLTHGGYFSGIFTPDVEVDYAHQLAARKQPSIIDLQNTAGHPGDI
jgi:hypothetical protein